MSNPEVSERTAGGLLELVMGPARGQILLAVEQPLAMSRLARLARLAPSLLTRQCERLAAAGLVQRENLNDEVWVSRTSRGASMVAFFAEAR
jgi:DNA-binding MarR family transcriptional regulator